MIQTSHTKSSEWGARFFEPLHTCAAIFLLSALACGDDANPVGVVDDASNLGDSSAQGGHGPDALIDGLGPEMDASSDSFVDRGAPVVDGSTADGTDGALVADADAQADNNTADAQ